VLAYPQTLRRLRFRQGPRRLDQAEAQGAQERRPARAHPYHPHGAQAGGGIARRRLALLGDPRADHVPRKDRRRPPLRRPRGRRPLPAGAGAQGDSGRAAAVSRLPGLALSRPRGRPARSRPRGARRARHARGHAAGAAPAWLVVSAPRLWDSCTQGRAGRNIMLRAVASLLIGLWVCAGPVLAQSDYPSRPVKILVPSSPGGGTDILARVLADYLSKSLNGQFFVENRPGAGQMIGIEVVAHAPNDGYTLLMAASTLAINPVMYKNVKYDAVKDFSPITLVAGLPNIFIVAPDQPIKSIADLIALAKRKPGEVTYASAGIGTSPHMGSELLKSLAGIEMQHVPFRGTAPGVTEVMAGRVTVGLANLLTAKPLI